MAEAFVNLSNGGRELRIAGGKLKVCNARFTTCSASSSGRLFFIAPSEILLIAFKVAHPTSAGIIAFEVQGLTPDQVVRKLHEQRIIASVTPGFYEPNLARVAPSLLTTEPDVARTVRAIASL